MNPRNQKTLLTLSFALCFNLAAGLAQAQYCPAVVGMSACDPAYPGVWARCASDAYMEDCLASGANDGECREIAAHVYNSEYNSASRDCSLIERECQLTGGFRNAYGGCSQFLASGGGGGMYLASRDAGGDGGFSCHADYLRLQFEIGGTWVTIWEGWGTVCEDEM